MPFETTLAIAKKNLRLDDEVRFLRSWLEKPMQMGAVVPSGKALARTMARFVDPRSHGPVIELGPGTGPVTEALLDHGVDQSRLVLLEYSPTFCSLLRARYPRATVVQGDAYNLRATLGDVLDHPAAALVSGLPLMSKPVRTRMKLANDAFRLLAPGAPFIQFTYAVVSPIPRRLSGMKAHATDPVWLNVPPARVWVYRKG
jgi:phosphatidylethanolamine/phosphatidyl-N-methylethanolamine N-methyltransferase